MPDRSRRINRALLTLVMVLGTVVSAAAADEYILKVRINDYSKLPPVTLRKAQEQVGVILEAAGITLLWLDAVPDARTPVIEFLTLNIHARDAADFPLADSLGFTPIYRRQGYLTYVIASRVAVEATFRGLELNVVLAMAIAHELGHLLMPGRPHSVRGVMHASFGQDDYRLADQGLLRFTAEETELLRNGIVARRESRSAGGCHQAARPRAR